MYIIYLLVLGQGCSALNGGAGVDHIVSVPLPSFSKISKIDLPKIAPVTVKEAPIEKVLAKKEKLEIFKTKPSDDLKIERRKLEAKDVAKLKGSLEKAPTPSEPIKKIYNIVEDKTPKPVKVEEFLAANLASSSLKDSLEHSNHELSYDTGITHNGFNIEMPSKVVSWSEAFGEGIEEELLALAETESQRVADLKNEQDESPLAKTMARAFEQTSKEDEVKSIQSGVAKGSYDPADPKMLAMFDNSQVNIEEIVKQREEKAQQDLTSQSNDDLVLIDYQEKSKGAEAVQATPFNEKNLSNLVATPISSAVQNVIKREMGPVERKLMKELNNFGPAKRKGSSNPNTDVMRDSEKENKLRNRVTLYTLEASLGEGFKGDVTNFNFIPSYDNNEVKEDYTEGFLNIDYSLNGETGVLRGTLVKNYFVRTTLEIPLGSEYSKFEIPMITQDSLIDYLDKNNLEGAGGFYLVDLGEFLEDVDLEKFNVQNFNVYEHRVLLSDDFKIVKEGGNYRYVLFIGVEPGNINVRYLGINGQETSKITFIAPEELTYDFSQLERPIDLKINTTLQHTLGKKPSVLDIEAKNIVNFLSGEKAEKQAPGEYIFKTPWKIKGSRSYFELGYLNDSIFVGLDRDASLELPSLEFIGEVMQAFQMDGINRECLLQLNMKKSIREIKLNGESDRGPTAYDLSYLDEDGVFSSELSPLSKKLFVLGNEEGIYNIKVLYEDGTSDYLRTYCSPSTYLLEQL